MSKKRHVEHENHERWLVSYADFITLLFAFFVVLYATSTKDLEKAKEFEESVREQFKMVAVAVGGGGNPNTPQAVNSQSAEMDLFDPLSQRKGAAKQVEEDIDQALDKKLTPAERKEFIQDLRRESGGVRISLASQAFFATNSAKLRKEAVQILNRVAEIIAKTPYSAFIEGHTDNQPIPNGSNWELGSLRATTVVRYFVEVHRMNPERFAAISYADQKPVASNSTEEGRSQNRRIEILLKTAQ